MWGLRPESVYLFLSALKTGVNENIYLRQKERSLQYFAPVWLPRSVTTQQGYTNSLESQRSWRFPKAHYPLKEASDITGTFSLNTSQTPVYWRSLNINTL
jgi:hypothetical protein